MKWIISFIEHAFSFNVATFTVRLINPRISESEKFHQTPAQPPQASLFLSKHSEEWRMPSAFSHDFRRSLCWISLMKWNAKITETNLCGNTTPLQNRFEWTLPRVEFISGRSVFCIRNQPRKGKTKNRAQEERISIASRRSVSIWKESYRSRVDRLIPICMIHIFNFNALKPSAEVLREWMFSFRYANCAVFFLHRAVSGVYNGRTRDPWAQYFNKRAPVKMLVEVCK